MRSSQIRTPGGAQDARTDGASRCASALRPHAQARALVACVCACVVSGNVAGAVLPAAHQATDAPRIGGDRAGNGETKAGATAGPSERLSQLRVFRPDFYANHRPRTALDMVFRTPGFELALGSGNRGLEGNAGNVLINGVRPPTKASPITEVLAGIPADDVKLVMLVPAGSLDVDMAGHPLLLYLVTATRSGVEGDLTVSGSSTGDLGRRSGLAADMRSSTPQRVLSANVRASDARQLTRGGLLAPLIGNASMRRTSGIEMNQESSQVSTTAQWQWPAGSRLQGRANLSSEQMAQLPLPTAWEDVVDMTNVSEQRGGDLALEWQHPLAKGQGELALTALHSTRRLQLESMMKGAGLDSATWQDRRSGETALRGTLRWKPSEAWRVQAGTDHATNFLDGELRYLMDGEEIAIPGAVSHVEELRSGAFALATWTPGERWTVEGALRWERSALRNRLDRSHDARFADWLPRATVTWNPQPNAKLVASVERKVGQLAFSQFLAAVDLDDRVVTAGAGTLEPERSWLAEVSYERRFGDKGLLQLSAGRERIDNPVDVVVLDDALQVTANVGAAVIDTFGLQLNAPLDGLGLPGGLLTLGRNEVASRMIDPVTGAEREVALRPSSGSLSLRQDLPGGRWAWGISAVAGDRSAQFGATEVMYLENEARVSAFGEWRPARSLALRMAYTRGGGTRIHSQMYLSPRRADAPPDLAYVQRSWTQPMWTASMEWMPRTNVRLDLGANSPSDSHMSGQVHAPVAGPFSQVQLSSPPTVSAQLKVSW